MSLKEPLPRLIRMISVYKKTTEQILLNFKMGDISEKIYAPLWWNSRLVGEFAFSEEFKNDLHILAQGIFQYTNGHGDRWKVQSSSAEKILKNIQKDGFDIR